MGAMGALAPMFFYNLLNALKNPSLKSKGNDRMPLVFRVQHQAMPSNAFKMEGQCHPEAEPRGALPLHLEG